MNTEFIALIASFGACIVTSVFMAVIVGLVLKHSARNNSGFNNIVYNTEQMKETLTEKCTPDVIKIKGTLEHPSILEFDNVVKAFESKDENAAKTALRDYVRENEYSDNVCDYIDSQQWIV